MADRGELMQGYMDKIRCSQVGKGVVISRVAVINDVDSDMEIRLKFANQEADWLEAKLRELRIARTPSIYPQPPTFDAVAINATVEENGMHRQNLARHLQTV